MLVLGVFSCHVRQQHGRGVRLRKSTALSPTCLEQFPITQLPPQKATCPHNFWQDVYSFGVFLHTFTQCVVDIFSPTASRFYAFFASRLHNYTALTTNPMIKILTNLCIAGGRASSHNLHNLYAEIIDNQSVN